MVAVPLVEEMSGSAAGAMIASLAGLSAEPAALAQLELLAAGRRPRNLALYAATAGFDLIHELDHLSARAIEPNVFFNPRVLAPAMPRLEDREIRLAVIRDRDADSNRLRMLMPFSVERPPIPLGVSILRAWSSPFGPVGTPLIDGDDPVSVVEDFFDMLSRDRLKLPKVLVLPDMRLDGTVAPVMRTVALGRDLFISEVGQAQRAFLESHLDGEDYLRNSLKAHHYREFRRLWRRLADKGELVYSVARQPDEVRLGVEAFLALEADGWKGRERTAMVVDRFRAAFAREAAYGLA
ncbi:MAG: GNAT family N-acetyltransferase, partial [Mesorhizobium sp.]